MSRTLERHLGGQGSELYSVRKVILLRSWFVVSLAGLTVSIFAERTLGQHVSAVLQISSVRMDILIAGPIGIVAATALWVGWSAFFWRFTVAPRRSLADILATDSYSFLAAFLLLLSLRYYGPLYLTNEGIVELSKSGYAVKLDPVTVGIVFLILTTALFVSLKVLTSSQRIVVHNPEIWLWISLLFYIVSSAWLHRVSYSNFSDHEESTAIFAQAFHNFQVNGAFFVNSMEGGSHLGIHASYFMFLLYPIFRLFNSMDFFFWITPLFLSASAYLFYTYAKSRIDPLPALLLTISFLLYPTIIYQSITDLHEMAWALPFFFLAVLAFERQSFYPFLVSIFVFLLVKENLALTAALFGIYAMIRRRSLRWIATPLVVSGLWFALTTKFLIPLAANGASYAFVSRRYSHLNLSGSITQMVLGILQDPQPILLHLLSWQPIKFTFDALASVGFISVFPPFSLLAIEPFLENVLQQEPYLVSWHATMIPAVLHVSLVHLLQWARNSRKLKSYFPWQNMVVTVSLVVLFMNLAAFHLWIIPSNISGAENKQGLQEIKSLIPADASVRAPAELLPHLAFRQILYGFAGYNYGETQSLEYLVLRVDMSDSSALLEEVQLVDGVRFCKIYQSFPYVVLQRDDKTFEVGFSRGLQCQTQ